MHIQQLLLKKLSESNAQKTKNFNSIFRINYLPNSKIFKLHLYFANSNNV